MTYHVQFSTARSSWLGQPPAAGCDRLPARGEPCAPSRASGQASQALGRRAAQARRQGPGFGPRGAGPDCVGCHTRYASALVPLPHRSQVRWQREPEPRPTSDGEGHPRVIAVMRSGWLSLVLARRHGLYSLTASCPEIQTNSKTRVGPSPSSSIIIVESATIKGLATRLCFWTWRGPEYSPETAEQNGAALLSISQERTLGFAGGSFVSQTTSDVGFALK